MNKKILLMAGSIFITLSITFYLFNKNQEKKMQEFLNSDISIDTETEEKASTSTSKTEINKINETKNTSAVKVETKPAETIKETPKTFTAQEVATHNTKNDCWMSINGKVLNVTSFISLHPGGDKILKGCGVDATGYFNKVPSHLQGTAQSLLSKLQIGTLSN